ncbi:uncharacterized protein LOC110733278 [Chenopodium quinoa]|uniref:uncharacterized protein LOC110733278 n=1 Tax=Chenopodium quinoa TaxID=63459 RepID=UPI000B783A0D|nr:uncharacterized protein LOC110733278 [Chenopodium quinoa]
MPRRAITKCFSPALLCFDPPMGNIHELDFTQYEYLFVDDDGEILATLSHETIAALILLPKSRNNDFFTTLQMRPVGSNNPPKPAHFPNIFDTYPVRDEFQVYLKWCLGTLPPSTYNPHKIENAMHVLDPRPQLNFDCPTWELDHVSIRVCVGAYTDSFQVFKVPTFPHILYLRVMNVAFRENVPGYHNVDFTPFTAKEAEYVISGHYSPIPAESRVCCWKVRGIGRPSLIENFIAMHRIHKPTVVVLLETRHGYETIRMLVKELPGNYCFGYSAPKNGLCGGTVYLWNDNVVTTEPKRCYSSSTVANVYFKGHPGSRRCLF